MAEPKNHPPTLGSRRWVLGVAALATPPIIAMIVVRFVNSDRTAPAPPVSASASAAPVVAPKTGRRDVHCARISPSFFTVEAGGVQDLRADFAPDGVGMFAFQWTATGGTLGGPGEEPNRPSVPGFVVLDDFDGDRLDDKLWKAEVPPGGSLELKNGELVMTTPGGGDKDQAVRVEGLFKLEGSFAAEVRVNGITVDGTRGTAALTFVTDDGFASHTQRIAETAFQSLEANTRNPNGFWQGATTIFDRDGPATVRLLRGGPTIGYQVQLGPEIIPLGQRFYPISVAAGHIVVDSWSLANHPSVTARFDNFGAAQNLSVTWRAPADAAVDGVYTIRLGDDCRATARITER